jgi:hypothetical protein
MNINDYLAALRFRGNDWTRIPAESLIRSLLFTSLTRRFPRVFISRDILGELATRDAIRSRAREREAGGREKLIFLLELGKVG